VDLSDRIEIKEIEFDMVMPAVVPCSVFNHAGTSMQY
jgi:hypothetical protein